MIEVPLRNYRIRLIRLQWFLYSSMKKCRFTLLLCFFALYFISVDAQTGCTDPQATNYDDNALINDGSCQYPPTDYQLDLIGNLPAIIKESSGLAYDQNRLFTINDAGNMPQLYQIDTLDGKVLRHWVIRDMTNIDWEDLTQDEQYIYIGDFGNNNGDRTDLRILRIEKIALNGADTIIADTITFSFSDQTDFTPNQNNNDYDCEAFFALGDSLYLFSKNWVNQKTRLYSLPGSPGQHIAQLQDSLAVGGYITGADIDEEGVVTLIGYTELSTFLWLLFDYPGNHFFSGNKRPINLGTPLTNSQTEGIVFSSNGEGYISAEELSVFNFTISPRFFRFTTLQWTDPVISSTLDNDSLSIDVFPNPFSENIHIESTDQRMKNAEIFLYDHFGRIVKNTTWKDMLIEIDTADLAGGTYWLVINSEWGSFRKVIIKK